MAGGSGERETRPCAAHRSANRALTEAATFISCWMPKRPRIDKSALAQPIPERERSGPYLDFVRRQACCVPECRSGMEVEAHHPIGGRGGKVRSSDFLAVPICTAHHTGANDALHRMGSERKWCEKHGVDLAYVQADLQRRWKAIKGGKR